MSVRARVASVAAGIAGLVGATAGVTYAATATSVPSNDYATACSNSLHTLRLADSKGACPSGYSHINLRVGTDRTYRERVRFDDS